jgi:hypothetical protein
MVRTFSIFPSPDVASFRDSGAEQLNGIPFLAPWANRTGEEGFGLTTENIDSIPIWGQCILARRVLP